MVDYNDVRIYPPKGMDRMLGYMVSFPLATGLNSRWAMTRKRAEAIAQRYLDTGHPDKRQDKDWMDRVYNYKGTSHD